MGANNSTQTSSSQVSETITNMLLQNVSSSIIATDTGNESIISGNDISANVNQVVKITINQQTVSDQCNSANLATAVLNQLAQTASESGNDTSMFSSSGTMDNSSIITSITNNFTQSNLETCVTNMDSSNVSIIEGSTISANIYQSDVGKTLQSCLFQGSDAGTSANTISNTVNQKTSYSPSGMFDWLASALETIFLGIFGLIAAIIICIAALYMLMHKHKHRDQENKN